MNFSIIGKVVEIGYIGEKVKILDSILVPHEIKTDAKIITNVSNKTMYLVKGESDNGVKVISPSEITKFVE
ncbi:MAG: hypothetical protein AB8G15_19640 [Saprospiraceae bacterium]